MCLNYGIGTKGIILAKDYKNNYKIKGSSIALLCLLTIVSLFLVDISSAFASGALDKIVKNLRDSFSGTPTLMVAIAYVIGLAFVISGIIKFKDHVDSPPNHPLKNAVVRLFIGGALFAFPSVLEAMMQTIGDGSAVGAPEEVPTGSSYGLGQIIQNIDNSFTDPGKLFGLIAYLFGIAFGLWSLVEFIKSADSPGQYPIRRPIMILLTGSALLSLPIIVEALRATFDTIDAFTYGQNGLGEVAAGPALDQIMARVVTNIHGPLITLIGEVSTIGGLAFMLVGIFRLMKSAQDGPKAPWGMGTIGTFLAASALLSIGSFMGGAQTSIFGTTVLNTYAVLSETEGMDPLVVSRANQAIQAVFMFVQIVGFISFVRGIFILRAYGEGDQQSSMSAGLTHIIGGAVAVNLTALVNAVQQTLGLVGLTFS